MSGPARCRYNPLTLFAEFVYDAIFDPAMRQRVEAPFVKLLSYPSNTPDHLGGFGTWRDERASAKLVRSNVRPSRPLLSDQQLAFAAWQVERIARSVRRQVHTVKRFRELPRQAHPHGYPLPSCLNRWRTPTDRFSRQY